MLSSLSLFLLGLAVGTFGTLVGIGGGVILVPIFLLLFHWTPQNTIATSLLVVCMNAVSGTIAYIRQKKVYYDAAVRFSLATLPGAFLGSYLAKYFTSGSFRLTFGALLMLIGILTYTRSAKKSSDMESFDKNTFTYSRFWGITLSFLIGFLSSILGIGGGIIHVPVMVYLLSFPTHIATATSHFVLAFSSFFGVISHFLLGHILLKEGLTIGIGAVIGAQIGARLSVKVKSHLILSLLSIALFLLGIRLVLTATSLL